MAKDIFHENVRQALIKEGWSITSDPLHIGQYVDYIDALDESEPERVLFLALPQDAYYHRVFQGRFIQKRLRNENVKLIIFDPLNNTIVEWKK